ncbi:efflux RND transporter permease subunit [Herbaspirillum sp. SJZ107]|uniref:efflux RND transporter permease subunit n=1 Tax=Herbaspirillum sp. SJZ107 TaxID=2572881 RepID=UPI00114DFA3D|nr:efflux RND transporter permease subunit [Herbaspirillum sp. SJZ107]TQK07361.1 multidrug efflux pump [Herbaspirillum sp. SJZ107]
MPQFFIRRPIFAIVLSLLIMLGGGLSIFSLPVEQFPPIAPPSVQINVNYAGASASTMQNTVVQVIEQQMSGIDKLMYMASTSDDSGRSTTTLTFETGADPDIAQVQVQNKLQLAIPQLPTQVQQSGVRVTKSSPSFLMVIGFVSTNHSMSKYDIANFLVSKVQDPISRVNGVGDLNVYGTQYAMRIWLDLSKLNSFQLNPTDVTAALTAQNVQVSAGQLGGLPAVGNPQVAATITQATLLRTVEDFGAVVLKTQQNGALVRLRDVARIERGPENFIVDNRYNGEPASGLGIQLAPGANALETAELVRARIAELQPVFPAGLKVVYPNDVTPFIQVSIHEVVKTLLEGIVLVVLVMYLFMQNIRATLIPSITVPVVLLGTFGLMAALGFTINTLSMFGLVLAIGLLVDDAIVVVENVERIMREEKLPAREATSKAMSQISGALIGVAMVLCAVFVPVAFSPGTVGAIYRQFALTIVVSMLLSVFVALSLSPALCAILLKDSAEHDHGFFGWFNRSFESTRAHYMRGVKGVARRWVLWMLVFAASLAATAFMFLRLPTSFLPNEDQGYMFVQVQTPAGATQNRTGQVLDEISQYLLRDEKAMVDATFTVNGNNNAGRSQSQGQIFVRLKDWDDRKDEELGVEALSDRIKKRFSSSNVAIIFPTSPPPIRGLGNAAGFDLQLQDRGGLGHDALAQARDQLLAAARSHPALAQVRYNGVADSPGFKVDVDREKAGAFGVAPSDIDQAFSIAWGSRYVNNFLDTDNRIKRVYVQADAPFRMNPEDLGKLYVRSQSGSMVPLTAVASGQWTSGPSQLQRYNGVESMNIQGQGAAGRSSGEAMEAMEELAKALPKGIGIAWTGTSYQQQQSGNQAPLLYALSILVVFLSLAALYESWSIPVAVILVVPIGVLGALAATMARGLTNDVYFQVGLLVTIGLSAKNAILVAEFAHARQAEGASAFDAAVEAAHMRIRPILMTSLAFILGVLPLAISRGAGAASQHAIGTGVIGGMLTATLVAPLMIPMFYIVVARLFGGRKKAAPAGEAAKPETAELDAAGKG